MKLPDAPRRTMAQIRARLYAKARQHNDPEIAALANETKRRFFNRVAPTKQAPITRAVVQAVRAMAIQHPKMHQREIGHRFGIDGGRVNEILHGFRNGQSYEERHF